MIEALQRELCAAFCGGLEVHPVPSGYAVSSVFEDSSGDRIGFYISETPDGFVIEDDGDFLAGLIARDIHIDAGMRRDLLDAILKEGGAFWDQDSYEIKTESFSRHMLAGRSIAFLSSLIRVRDLALISRERVKSAFREDFLRALTQRFEGITIEESVAPANDLSEFPADIVVRGLGDRTGAIYLVNNTEKLNEALLAWLELGDHREQIGLVAVVEDMDLTNISKRKFQRAQNRRLPMPVFRGDEPGTLEFIRKEMRVGEAT